MSVSRRTFLAAGQALLATAAFPMRFLGAAASNFGPSAGANLLTATKATFQPLVNSSFAVRSGLLTPAWLTLLSVEDLNPTTPVQTKNQAPRANGLRTPQTVIDTFALNFYGTGEMLPQGTYELEHHTLGQFSLFIVPSRSSTYTAIISHIQSAVPIIAPKPAAPKAQAVVPAGQ